MAPTTVRFHQFDFAHMPGSGLQNLVSVKIEGVLALLVNKARQRLTDERFSLHSQQAGA